MPSDFDDSICLGYTKPRTNKIEQRMIQRKYAADVKELIEEVKQ
jgi:hypothetical protein